jgi:hypothetical protein
LTTVSEQYRTRFQSYSTSLANLQTENYIDNVLGSGAKSGYTFTYTGAVNTWSCTANPTTKGTTGDRFFFVDQSGVIRFSSTGAATATSGAID